MKTFDFAITARTIIYWTMTLILCLCANVQAQTIVGNFAVMSEHALHQDQADNTIAANPMPLQSPSLLSANSAPSNRNVNVVSAVTAAPLVQRAQGEQSAPEQSTSSAKTSQIVFPELPAQSSQALRLLMSSPQ